jgi:hypothetical protein
MLEQLSLLTWSSTDFVGINWGLTNNWCNCEVSFFDIKEKEIQLYIPGRVEKITPLVSQVRWEMIWRFALYKFIVDPSINSLTV